MDNSFLTGMNLDTAIRLLMDYNIPYTIAAIDEKTYENPSDDKQIIYLFIKNNKIERIVDHI